MSSEYEIAGSRTPALSAFGMLGDFPFLIRTFVRVADDSPGATGWAAPAALSGPDLAAEGR